MLKPLMMVFGGLIFGIISAVILFFGYLIQVGEVQPGAGIYVPSFFCLAASFLAGFSLYLGVRRKGIGFFLLTWLIAAVGVYGTVIGLFLFTPPTLYLGAAIGIICGAMIGISTKRQSITYNLAFIVIFLLIGIGAETLLPYWGSLIFGTLSGGSVGWGGLGIAGSRVAVITGNCSAAGCGS